MSDYPALKLEGNEITLVGVGLLRAGRYELVREDHPLSDLIGIKAEVDGKAVVLDPDDVEFVYADTPLAS